MSDDCEIEMILAKWNLLEDCIPPENGMYVVTVDVTGDLSDQRKIGMCAYVDGEWYTTRGAYAVIESRRIHKWYSVSIPDPYEDEKP